LHGWAARVPEALAERAAVQRLRPAAPPQAQQHAGAQAVNNQPAPSNGGMIFGVKKTVFNSDDFSTIALSSYSPTPS
jgi:hypothetical protein